MGGRELKGDVAPVRFQKLVAGGDQGPADERTDALLVLDEKDGLGAV